MKLFRVQLDDDTSSCVLEPTDIIILKEGLNEREQKILTTLQNLGEQGASAMEWLRATEMPDKTFYRGIKVLGNHGYVHHPEGEGRGSHYCLTEKGKEAVTVA